MNIEELLEFEEGFRAEPYIDSEGYPTCGIGTKLGPKNTPLSFYEFTFTPEVARLMLSKQVELGRYKLGKLDWYNSLTHDRKIIIQSMHYQLGYAGLLGFKKMIQAIKDEDWAEVKAQSLDSKWFKQTPERAKRHASVLGGSRLIHIYK